jgi:pyruvate formate lyase activating enzyme
MQADFVLKTLSLLPCEMHKAVETSGYGREEDFLKFVEAFDLVIMDVKCMDDEVHKRYTRVSNEQILQNAGLLCKGNTPFIIRIPVIPNVNDNLANYRAVAELVSGAKALIRVELLPYHVTAGAKYSMLNQAYQPGFEESQAVRVNLDVFAEYGIRSCVL